MCFIVQAYSLPIFASVYPPLNNYIRNVLLESFELMSANKLRRVELRIHKDETIYESFFIDINKNDGTLDCDQIEDDFRSCLHSLEKRCKLFKRASKDSSFKILLHTEAHNVSNDSKCQVKELKVKESLTENFKL